VTALWLGTPCSSWSTARRGRPGSPGGPLRTVECIWGVPEALARPKDAAKIEVGNRTMRMSARLLAAAIRRGIPCAIENPASSRIWHAPPIAQLALREDTCCHVLDFCQFGSRHRKRTRLLSWHTGMRSELFRMCTGRKGRCSCTGKFHVILQGTDKGTSLTRTALASPYPKSFAAAAARLLLQSAPAQTLAC